MILFVFTVTRLSLGQAKHYKKWQLCLVWTTAVFTSLFFIAKAHMIICMLMSAFSALIVSGRANLRDMFMWRAQPNSDVYEWCRFNPTDERLDDIADYCKSMNGLMFDVFKLCFIEQRPWSEVADILGIDTPRISPIAASIAHVIRANCMRDYKSFKRHCKSSQDQL